MIVVPDYMTTIKNQWIEYLVDKTVTFNDRKTGKERTWTQKDIATKQLTLISTPLMALESATQVSCANLKSVSALLNG